MRGATAPQISKPESNQHWLEITFKGAPIPLLGKFIDVCFALEIKILQKPTDSVPQQDCEDLKLKSGCKN